MRRWIHNDTPCRQECDGDMGFEVEVEDAKDYDKLRDEVGRRYSVHEIRHYLLGGLYTRDKDPDGIKCIENTALLVVIRELEDKEEGIASVIGSLRKELSEVKTMLANRKDESR